MITPINGQNFKRFESIPNQIHIVFGWEFSTLFLYIRYLKAVDIVELTSSSYPEVK